MNINLSDKALLKPSTLSCQKKTSLNIFKVCFPNKTYFVERVGLKPSLSSTRIKILKLKKSSLMCKLISSRCANKEITKMVLKYDQDYIKNLKKFKTMRNQNIIPHSWLPALALVTIEKNVPHSKDKCYIS